MVSHIITRVELGKTLKECVTSTIRLSFTLSRLNIMNCARIGADGHTYSPQSASSIQNIKNAFTQVKNYLSNYMYMSTLSFNQHLMHILCVYMYYVSSPACTTSSEIEEITPNRQVCTTMELFPHIHYLRLTLNYMCLGKLVTQMSR